MTRHTLIALTTAVVLSGCAQQPLPATSEQLTNAMDVQLARIETAMVRRCEQEQLHQQAHNDYQNQIVGELVGMNAGLTALAANIQQPAPECPEVADPLTDKLVLGEVERVYVQEVGEAFEARVDTGAASSSISAANIRLFERDGKQWVRFEIPTNGDVAEDAPDATIEAPISRFVNIKRASSAEPERRPVIIARLKVGDYVAETELNLTDRSHMEYTLLLGRKFFKDIAVVDVSRQYVLSGANGQ
ncbi:ATP-dependent zinc protease family protein [Ferrimonas pelagia]|uniref:Retropepsin-like aspartic endopeptidase domain-containing protein n=1 Tax=Ferrimonas pelagia TaxID=1177826 RepID=A0ABP9EMF8_9GAMM